MTRLCRVFLFRSSWYELVATGTAGRVLFTGGVPMCAIAGAFGVPDAAYVISLMLKAMQHRGQQAAGIVACHGGTFRERRGFGLVDEVFGHVDVAALLPGTSAVGHVRYPTAGDPESPESIQPLTARLRAGPVALVHNGNLTNFREQRAALEE